VVEANRGLASSTTAVARVAGQSTRSPRRWWLAVFFWSIFGAGLLVQVFAPRLKIEHNAFVIPPSLVSGSKEINPAEIVARERRMQLLSGLLTLSGAVGLAFYYRKTLMGRRSP
jgi:hypothetical protein